MAFKCRIYLSWSFSEPPWYTQRVYNLLFWISSCSMLYAYALTSFKLLSTECRMRCVVDRVTYIKCTHAQRHRQICYHNIHFRTTIAITTKTSAFNFQYDSSNVANYILFGIKIIGICKQFQAKSATTKTMALLNGIWQAASSSQNHI